MKTISLKEASETRHYWIGFPRDCRREAQRLDMLDYKIQIINSYVFYAARTTGLAIAGSIAIAVGRKKAIKKPGDIDFVAPDLASAQYFVRLLEEKLFEYHGFWKVMVNHKTDFCPPGCITHFRIQTGFWMPICVMVIPTEKFKIWKTYGNTAIQSFNTVVEAATALDERDSKGRVTEEIKEAVVEPEAEPVGPLMRLIEEEEAMPDPWDMTGFRPPQFKEDSYK